MFRYEDSCLLKRVNASDVPLVSGLPGQRTGPDDQCRQIYGEASYLCRVINTASCNSISGIDIYVRVISVNITVTRNLYLMVLNIMLEMLFPFT